MNKNIGDMNKGELKDFIMELQEENSRYERKNKKLENNWNKLKKFLKETLKENFEWDKKHNCEWKGYNAYSELLDKMQELEKGKSE